MSEKKVGQYISITLLIITIILLFIGLKKYNISDPEGVYRTFNGTLITNDVTKEHIVGYIAIGICGISSLINLLLFIFKKNNLCAAFILTIIFLIGIVLAFLVYSGSYFGQLYNLYDANRGASGEELIFFSFVLFVIAALIAVVSIVIYYYFRNKIFETTETNGVNALIERLGQIGIMIIALGALFGGAAIPFSSTTTASNSFVDYDSNVGFVEKTYYYTKYLFSGNAYGTLAIIPMIIFLVMSIKYIYKKYKGDDDYDAPEKYRNIVILCAIAGNVLEFINLGGWSIIFGVGFFIIISGLLVHWLFIKIDKLD